MATFITAKSVGESLGLQVYSSTFFWKYNHDGADSTVKTAGYSSIPVTNANGEFTIISCDANGNESGYLQTLYLDNNQLTSFDGTGLSNLTGLVLNNNQLTSCSNLPSSLTSLYLHYNQLTSFDGTGLSSLTYLYLQGNQLTSFDGTGLSSLNQLHLNENQLTSFDGTGFYSLTTLALQNNQLTSFDGTDLTSLYYLGLDSNQLTSLDVSPMVSLTNLYLADAYGTLTNPMTAVSNNSILDQLNANGVENGNFFTINGRTSAGTADYDSLVGKGWNLLGLDLMETTTTTTTASPVTGNGKLRIKGVNSGGGTTTTTTTEAPTTTTTTTEPVFYTYDFTSFGVEAKGVFANNFNKEGVTNWDGTYRIVATDLNTGTLVYYIGTDGDKHLFTFNNVIIQDASNGIIINETGINGITILGTVTFDSVTPFVVTTTTTTTEAPSVNKVYTLGGFDVATTGGFINTMINQYVAANSLTWDGTYNFVVNGEMGVSKSIYFLDNDGYKHLLNTTLSIPLHIPLVGGEMGNPDYLFTIENGVITNIGNQFTTTYVEDYVDPSTTTTTTEAPSYTIKTIKPVGESFGIQNIVTSTGYWLYSHDGTNSAPYEGNATSITVTNANGEFTFISCLSDGTPSGNIIELGFANGSLITDFNGLDLSDLTYLNLFGEKLTSFDGTGLSSLTDLNLNSNEELTSITNLPLTLVSLTLVGSPITSIDISGMNSLTSLYLADAYGTNALVTSTNNSSILAQLDSSNISDGTFITSNGRTSAGNTSYDNLINKGWNIMGAEEEISLLFDLTVDNGIPNQLVVLITASSGGPTKGPGGPTKGPGGPGGPGGHGPGGGITEYDSIVTDENGIAVFSGITGSTTMWAVQVYNTPVKEGMVVWMSPFEANNSTTSVTQTRTFYDVNFLNQDDNGVISNSSVDIYLVGSGLQGISGGDIYPIFMFSGTTDVNGNITTNLSNGSYIIRTFDENGDLTWGQYFGVADDVVSITRPLSEDVSISLDLRSSWSNQNYSNINTIKVDGLDIYYYDGQQNIYSFNPENPINGDNPIVNPPLVYLGVTDENGLFTTESPIAISSGYLGIQTGTEDANGIIYEEKITEHSLSDFNLVGGIREYIWSDYNLQTPYATWDITVYKPSGELAYANLVTLDELIGTDVNNNLDWYGNVDMLNIGNNQWGIQSSPYKSFKLKGGTTYRINIYNGPNMIDGYTEIWTPGWNESKSTVWTRSYVS